MALFLSPGNGKPADPLTVIRSYLALAIQIGAPAYNHGDHRGCYEVYACTARMLLQALEGAKSARDLLREALERCSTVVDVNQQAWIMRHAFDAILDQEGNGAKE
jgi:hypothetical protein